MEGLCHVPHLVPVVVDGQDAVDVVEIFRLVAVLIEHIAPTLALLEARGIHASLSILLIILYVSPLFR